MANFFCEVEPSSQRPPPEDFKKKNDRDLKLGTLTPAESAEVYSILVRIEWKRASVKWAGQFLKFFRMVLQSSFGKIIGYE